MSSETILANAIENGFGELYQLNDAFRAVYDHQFDAVQRLPPQLIERGRALRYPQLHGACLEGDKELVQAFLAMGVGPDIYTNLNDDEDDTPLEWLAGATDIEVQSRIEIAKLLIDAGAYMDEALFRATNNSDETFADFLRGEGAEDDG